MFDCLTDDLFSFYQNVFFFVYCSSKFEVYEILSFSSVDPRSDPHRKICVWRYSGNECWPDDSAAAKGLKRPILPLFLHRIRFVISRSCVRVTLPAPEIPANLTVCGDFLRLLGGSKIEPQYSDVDFDPMAGKYRSASRYSIFLLPLLYWIDCHLFSLSLAHLNDKLGSSRFSIPKSDHLVCISNDLQISPWWCATAIPAIFRQELCQLQPLLMGILLGAGIYPLCSTGYNLSHSLGQIIFQILNLQSSWTYNCDFHSNNFHLKI